MNIANEVTLHENKYNGDTCLYRLRDLPNAYLTQDKRTLLILEPYTDDGNRYDIEIVEGTDKNKNKQVTTYSVWTIAWAQPAQTIVKLGKLIDKAIFQDGSQGVDAR